MPASETDYDNEISDIFDVIEDVESDKDISVNISRDDVATLLNEYVQNRVEPSEAVEYATRYILSEAGIDSRIEQNQYLLGQQSPQQADSVAIDELTEESEWGIVEGVVIELWEPNDAPDSIVQKGRLADESGSMIFTVWDTALEQNDDHIPLTKDSAYQFDPVVTNIHNGVTELSIQSTTDITSVDKTEFDIDTESYTETVTGAVVDFHQQTGLFVQCPECSRLIPVEKPINSDDGKAEGKCDEHGTVEGTLRLQTRAIIDDGTDTWQIHLDAQQTHNLTNIDLEESVSIHNEYNSSGVVQQAIEGCLHGEYIWVTGRHRDRRFYVDSCEYQEPPSINTLNETQDNVENTSVKTLHTTESTDQQ